MRRYRPFQSSRRRDAGSPAAGGSPLKTYDLGLKTDVVYGRRPVFEVFQAGRRSVHKVWLVRGTSGGVIEDVLRLARERGVPVDFTDRGRLDHMVRGNHQGIAAQVSATRYLELEEYLASIGGSRPVPLPRREGPKVLLALDEIQDPQNVGAILRSAGFFGVDAVVVPRWRSAPVGEAASRASSGALEHVPVIRVRNLADALLQMKEAGFEVVGADAAAAPMKEYRPQDRTVLVMGNEGSGLRRLVRERCDRLVGIPRRGPVGSLNVAAATAVALYEYFRNR